MDDPPGSSSSLVCAAKEGVFVVTTTFCDLACVPTAGGGEEDSEALGVLCVTLAEPDAMVMSKAMMSELAYANLRTHLTGGSVVSILLVFINFLFPDRNLTMFNNLPSIPIRIDIKYSISF